MAETKANKKQNPLVTYLKGAYAELRKVTWPTRKETWRKSWIVVWFSLGFAIFLGASDYLLNKLLEVLV